MIRFFTLALGLLLLVGCHKDEKKADTGPINLPGADKVLEAMTKKDYEAAVLGVADIKAALEPAKKAEYNRLLEKVMFQLTSEKGENEQAAQAYRSIVALESGR